MTDKPETISARVAHWLGEQQDWLFWVPISLALVLIAWRYLPMLDPRAGVDSLGELQGYAMLLFKGSMCCAMAWLCKRLYGVFKTDADIGSMQGDAIETASWQAVSLLILDRLEVFAWLAFWFYCFSG